MLAWEEDLSKSWQLETWHRNFSQSYKGILNTGLVEASMKVLTRWYLVPSKIARFYPLASPLCFWGCGIRGDMLHTWWTCPRVRPFWHRIFTWISKIAERPVQASLLVALLNFPVREVPRATQRLIFFIILGAKLTLAKAWKKSSVSTTLAKRKISWIMNQEKMASMILDSSTKFKQIWEPWANYIGITL